MTQLDCLNDLNPFAGFDADHNGKCPKAAGDPSVHLTTVTHHVRIGGSCMTVCEQCAEQYSKRKDATVRKLVTSPRITQAVPAVHARYIAS